VSPEVVNFRSTSIETSVASRSRSERLSVLAEAATPYLKTQPLGRGEDISDAQAKKISPLNQTRALRYNSAIARPERRGKVHAKGVEGVGRPSR